MLEIKIGLVFLRKNVYVVLAKKVFQSKGYITYI